MDGQKERQGDFVFTATEAGEYKFCFNNQMSTFAEKFVDFEIAVWFPLPLSLPSFYITVIDTVRTTGRARKARLDTLEKRHIPRTNLSA